MDIKQLKKDFRERVIISRSTWWALLESLPDEPAIASVQDALGELTACLRQYRHNDGGGNDAFVFGYEKSGVDRLVSRLAAPPQPVAQPAMGEVMPWQNRLATDDAPGMMLATDANFRAMQAEIADHRARAAVPAVAQDALDWPHDPANPGLPAAPSLAVAQDAQGDSEMLPCPFCGSAAHVSYDPMGLATNANAHCVACRADIWTQDGKDAAIALWNKRAAPSLPAVAPQEQGIPELRKAFITLESSLSQGAEGRSIVLKFNQREDAYAVHDFLLKACALPEVPAVAPAEQQHDGRPKRVHYTSQGGYDRAYDRWSESQG